MHFPPDLSPGCAKSRPKAFRQAPRLAAYSAMAAGVLLNTEASAFVNYTDLDPDSVLVLGDQIFRLDLNADGIVDFKFGVNAYSDVFTMGSVAGQEFYFNGAFAFGEGNNSFAGAKQELPFNTYFLPYVYEFGQYIGWDANWQPPAVLGSLNYLIDPEDSAGTSGGYWDERTDGYLGIRFEIGTNVHIGWVRLDVGTPGGSNTIVVKDFAWEGVAWSGITAGAINGGVDPAVGLEPTLLEEVSAYSYNGTVFIQHERTEPVLAELYDLQGKLLWSAKSPSGQQRFSVHYSGVAILRLRASEGVLTRRLFL